MTADISYTEAQIFYAHAVDEIVAKLRKGKSIQKNAKPSDLKYTLEWGIMIDGKSKTALDSWPEYWQDIKPRLHINLRGGIKRWWGYSTRLAEPPPQIEAFYKNLFDKTDRTL